MPTQPSGAALFAKGTKKPATSGPGDIPPTQGPGGKGKKK